MSREKFFNRAVETERLLAHRSVEYAEDEIRRGPVREELIKLSEMLREIIKSLPENQRSTVSKYKDAHRDFWIAVARKVYYIGLEDGMDLKSAMMEEAV